MIRPLIGRTLVLSSFLLACSGGDDGPTDTPDATVLPDSGEGDTTVADVDEDGTDPDAGLDADEDSGDDTPEVTPDDRPYGESCEGDAQCEGNLCLLIDASLDTGFCSGFCFEDTDCPEEDWSCVFLANSGGDAAFVCVPDELCIDEDEDGFGIGPGCDGQDCNDENPTVFLGADERCDGIDNDCDGIIDDNSVDSNVECATGFTGQCSAGLALCIGGFIECNAIRPGSAEICDTVDNDCDGEIDESVDGGPFAEACYGGPDDTVGVGECAAGTRLCVDGSITACSGQILPLPEVCDGLDNDCDGTEDEGSPGTGILCETELAGVCRRGLTSCGEGASDCQPIDEPSEEICDGLDNDCDGVTDESADGEPLTRDCYGGEEDTIDVGTCVGGTQTCTSGEWSSCDGEVLPTIELCSTFDEDCDGMVNEGNPASGFLCETGSFGLCAFGRTECGEGGTSGAECIADFEPAEELCDGFDNDCDNSVDEAEGGESLSRICYDGPEGTADQGLCSSGVESCAFGDWSSCVGQVLPTVELCDGEDNDCDGEADEGGPGSGIACTTGLSGVCALGTSACGEDGEIVCVATAEPTEEVCDGMDNDCDGEIDEGVMWEGLGTLCFAGAGLCQASGLLQCNPEDPTGPAICSATASDPTEEICDGADNDCDGETDEGEDWEDLGETCVAGDGICQRAGIRVCDPEDGAEPTVCGAVPGDPTEEVCDGLDNDCDGETDEGAMWEDVGSVCTVGDGICQRAGVLACNPSAPAGDAVCNATEGDPSTEICDGLDNDCDGETDEEYPTLGDSCVVGDGVCRAAGVVVCDGDSAVACDATVPDPPSVDELACDYLDDDCDGEVDEDYRTGGLYDGVENCGGCGVDCNGLWSPSAAAFHVVPVCNTFLLVSSCDYECESGWFDLDLDPSNGCEFQPDEGAVYVTTADAGGSDGATCGEYDAPCATIGFAISLADPDTRPRVRVSDGLWTESVTMRSGVSLLGGHNSVNWVRNPGVNVSAISGLDEAIDNSAVVAAGIDRPTELSGFTITAAPGRTGGGNSVGVHVIDSDENLLVTGNRIFAASGGGGAVGAEGDSGSNGIAGTAGAPSVIDGDGCTGDLAGGASGAHLCGVTPIDGGVGGDSECPDFDTPNDSGDAGDGLLGGDGGSGGGHLLGTSSFTGSTCTIGTTAADAGNGLAGASGVDGVGGSGGAAGLSGGTGQVRAESGVAGTAGTHGSGGGGGGAAAGVQVDGETEVYYGASGGGGGSGGCAANAGLGGGAGGGSFPVLVYFSAPPSGPAAMPQITANDLTRGQGGRGGSGGNGGAGGEPGAGAAGGAGLDGGTFGFCMLDAGAGASGGRGGHGGGGGGGTGGPSFDIFVWNSGGADPGYAVNTFVRGSTDTAGAGGSGGLAVNPVAVGTAGSAGQSGTVGTAP